MALKDRILGNPVVATVLSVQKRTKADAADQFAASIGFFGFVSLIPLLIIVVAVAAQVLAGQPDRITELVDNIGQAIPGLADNDSLQSAIDGIIRNGGSIGLVGGITLLISGLRVTNALQTATRFVFNMPLAEAKAAKLWMWKLLSLLILGTLALAGVVATSFAASLATSTLGERFGVGAVIAGFAIGAVLDILLFWVAYWVYTQGAVRSWRDLVPGAIFGGLGWALLKSFGAAYASSQAAGITENTTTSGSDAAAGAVTAGVIASMIGLLLLFYIAGRLYVYGAELSATMMGLDAEDAVAVTGSMSEVPDDGADTDDDEAEVDEVEPEPSGQPRVDTSGSLAERFRERGALVDDSVVAPTPDGTGTELVPWQAPEGSKLDDRRTRQVAAFAASAVAVVTAGLLGRRR